MDTTAAHNTAAAHAAIIELVDVETYGDDHEAAMDASRDGVDDCRRNGLIAGGLMEQTSNKALINEICIHGETELKINNNNVIECGVVIGMPSVGNNLKGRWAGQVSPRDPCSDDPSDLRCKDPLLEPEQVMLEHALTEQSMPSTAAAEFDNALEIFQSYADYAYDPDDDPHGVLPDWVTRCETSMSDGASTTSRAPCPARSTR